MSDVRFKVMDTEIAGLKVVSRSAIGDERGFLSRLFCANELSGFGWSAPVMQINQTLTRAVGSIRGLHIQNAPFAEDKFVSVICGKVLDVAVDLREGSDTFLQWHGEILSDSNRRSLLIPKGFAHGFQTLVPDCELLYLHSQCYEQSAEWGLNPFDPRLAINWPLPAANISARDRAHPMLGSEFTGIAL